MKFVTMIKNIKKDKLMHYVGSGILFILIFFTLTYLEFSNSVVISASLAWLVGICKETYDYVSGKGTPDVLDIVSNTAGIISALVILCVLWC